MGPGSCKHPQPDPMLFFKFFLWLTSAMEGVKQIVLDQQFRLRPPVFLLYYRAGTHNILSSPAVKGDFTPQLNFHFLRTKHLIFINNPLIILSCLSCICRVFTLGFFREKKRNENTICK